MASVNRTAVLSAINTIVAQLTVIEGELAAFAGDSLSAEARVAGPRMTVARAREAIALLQAEFLRGQVDFAAP